MDEFLYGDAGSPTHQEERYERALAEQISWRKQFSLLKIKLEKKPIRRKRKIPNIRYSAFYSESKYISLALEKNQEEKQRLLVKYFPYRFGPEGKQPIKNLDGIQGSKIFRRMVEYSIKRINQ